MASSSTTKPLSNVSARFAWQLKAVDALPADSLAHLAFNTLLTNAFSSINDLANKLRRTNVKEMTVAENQQLMKELAVAMAALEKQQLITITSRGPDRYRVPEPIRLYFAAVADAAAEAAALAAPADAQAAQQPNGKKQQAYKPLTEAEKEEKRQRYHTFMETRRANEEAVLRFLVGDDGSLVGTFHTVDVIQEATQLDHSIVLGVLYANRNEATVHQLSEDLSVVVTSDDHDPNAGERVWGALAFVEQQPSGIEEVVHSNNHKHPRPSQSKQAATAAAVAQTAASVTPAASNGRQHKNPPVHTPQGESVGKSARRPAVAAAAATAAVADQTPPSKEANHRSKVKHAREHKSARANTSED